MLPVTASEWMREIRADETARDKIVKRANEMVKGFHGRAYADSWEGESDNPENHAFKMVSSILPLLAHSNPKATVGSRKNGPTQEWTKALQHGLNRWLTLTRFHRLSEKLATDFCFSWAATLTSVQVRPGFEEAEDPPYWPQVARLSTSQFGFDRLAYSFEEARYIWHKVVIDRDDLVAQATADAEKPEEQREGWIIDGVRAMGQTSGIGTGRQEEEVREDEVSYYEVWDRSGKVDKEKTAEMGYHGSITRFAVGAEGSGVQICKPFDYWGPRWGPYTLYGCFTVPDHPWPLSILMATFEQERELNATARMTTESGRKYKRAFFADDEDLTELMKESQHDHVYFHPNLMASKTETAEFGGITDQMIAQEARLRDALERNSGLTEVEQGNLSGVSATETSIATSAASKRQSYYVRKFGDSVRANLETVLWFLANHDSIVYELGEDAAKELGMQQPMFVGGPDNPEQGTLDNLEIELDVRSMGHKTQQEESQDAMNKLTIVSELANLAVTSPARVRELAQQVGEGMGWPDLPDLIDFELAAQMQALQMGSQDGQGGGPAPFTPPPQPRLSITQTGRAAGQRAHAKSQSQPQGMMR